MNEELKNRLNDIEYLLFDLDGTLLTSAKVISEYSARTLLKAQEKGYKVAFSTGRSLCALGGLTYPHRLTLNAPSIGCAGGEIGYLNYDKVDRVFYDPFPLEDLETLLTTALVNGLNFSMDGVGRRYFSEGLYYKETYRRGFDEAARYGLSFPELVELKNVEEIVQTLDGTVVKPMIWFTQREQLKMMEPWFREHPGYTTASSGFKLIEVLPERVSKATALERACMEVGTAPEKCCVFGDSENDLSILARAGVSVAMCNGFEVTRESADIVTDFNNDEDGAARMVEKLFLA